MTITSPVLRVIGAGRAGRSLAQALGDAGWDTAGFLGRADDLSAAASDCDVLVISTPDGAVADVARVVEPGDALVVHMSGSLGLGVLGAHPRRASLHPLVALPSPEVGARRLRGAWYAVATEGGGDPTPHDVVMQMVADLDGRAIEVDDTHRAAYHAAACIASNHLVTLLAQVERVAATAGVPLEAYLDLVRATIDNVVELGPARALTGPAARGDIGTLNRHLAALGHMEHADAEVELYDTLASATRRLAAASGADFSDPDPSEPSEPSEPEPSEPGPS